MPVCPSSPRRSVSPLGVQLCLGCDLRSPPWPTDPPGKRAHPDSHHITRQTSPPDSHPPSPHHPGGVASPVGVESSPPQARVETFQTWGVGHGHDHPGGGVAVSLPGGERFTRLACWPWSSFPPVGESLPSAVLDRPLASPGKSAIGSHPGWGFKAPCARLLYFLPGGVLCPARYAKRAVWPPV